MWLKNWFALRARRQHSLDVTKRTVGELPGDHCIYNSGYLCHLCREETYTISKVNTSVCVSPAGERFSFSSYPPLAHLCPRCQCISWYNDGSGNKTHVDEWDPKTWVDSNAGWHQRNDGKRVQDQEPVIP